MPITARQLNRTTLSRQMLVAREQIDVAEAVRRVVAVQAQEPASPYVALWNRVEGFDPADLDRAFRDHRVVKATLVRITLHAVHADDYPSFHEAMLPNLRASRLNDRRYTTTGMSAADADDLIPHLVSHASETRSKEEIEAMLADRLGEPPHERLWWALRTFAPVVHAPTGGPWSFGQRPSFRSAPTEPARPSFEVALQALIRRYLEGFGPASAQDFAQFALQRQSEIRPALEAMRDELVGLEGPDGAVLYDVPGSMVADDDVPAPPRLMAMWDSTLLAYADRRRIIPEEYRKVVIRSNGDVLPTLLVDGHVCGVWRHVGDGIEATAFRPLSDDEWAGLEREAGDLLSLLAERDRNVYSRYHRWWGKLPVGETRVLTASS